MRYPISLKREVVKKAKELLNQGVSLRKTAASFDNHLKLSAIQLSNWIKKEEKMNAADPISGIVMSAQALSLHPGKQSTISGISAQLLEWITQNRDKGMPVSRNMVIIKASSLDANFRRKSASSKYAIICRFLYMNKLVIRSRTHQAQKSRRVMEQHGQEFVASIVPRLQEFGRDQRFIINMDQTPVFFSMTPKTTLQVRGSKTVSVRASSDSTKRITVAVTVTASGVMLAPYVIFNAMPNGRIERQLANFPPGAHYAVQKNAWMDERVMLMWVESVLEPYVKTAPDGVRPILFLDSYRCHMMASVVQRVQELGVEVQHIPGGCTGVCQPVDVGIGKPFKNRVTRCWEDWMVEEGGLDEEKTKTPSREEVAEWVVKSIGSIGPQIVRNSWRHQEFSYFPSESKERVVVVNKNLDIDDGGGDENDIVSEFDDDDDDSLIDESPFRSK
jgi:hypothetical protein